MDQIQGKTESNSTAEEGLITADNQANDQEWNQFIKQELEKQNKQEGKAGSLSMVGKEDILNTIIEKIPVEDLINSTVKMIKEKVEAEIKRKKKNKNTNDQTETIEKMMEKKYENTNKQAADKIVKKKNRTYKSRQKERRKELYRNIYG
ncbi:hypothetical protein GI584_22985 [Gracilibacillus salitolerans]|uniref:Uncharacterized protein n=1 Tax=Gracilibacillus salitolerans TaxID=2663022 RepID=A0A5Q2TRU5_9BACI|nr:hypothetical protein [Gracilibacillus salitolerans]QGH36743.1 hypothetical protein GI584_22985 [Gracilibacillus salitolerans]